MFKIDHLLVLPRLYIQNANIISSPMTWGFPAMSAFVGFMHALERKLPDDIGLVFNEIGVVCHRIEPQVTTGTFVKGFHLTRNPVDKSGNASAIVEEGRAHLCISLLISVGAQEGSDDLRLEERRQQLADQIHELVQGMRIAGGSVLPVANPKSKRSRPKLVSFDSDEYEKRAHAWRVLKRQLLPGFALVLRDDALQQHTAALKLEKSSATALDAWLDLSRLNHECQRVSVETDDGDTRERIEWTVRRPFGGWLVPIPVGYGAISPLYGPGEVDKARDNSTSFQFVETLHSIGEWVSPHRIKDPSQLLWFVENELDRGIYRLNNT
ncbi:CRISPR-associated protein Csy2 [Halomonadaceae bacterium LMG 33818]|uniref:type I-F CRISPR-associated protein Csy2 n=1 Tax=Cernens ardua TaxID=3402176 RepID=UPI003EDC24A3